MPFFKISFSNLEKETLRERMVSQGMARHGMENKNGKKRCKPCGRKVLQIEEKIKFLN